MKQNYLVNIFADGRYIKSYYSESLSELAYTMATNREAEISVYDMNTCSFLTSEQIGRIVQSNSEPKKQYAEVERKKAKGKKKIVDKKKGNCAERWGRPVKCVETGRVYPSIRACSKEMGIPHKAIWNAINSGRSRCGYHFMNVKYHEIK